MPCYIVRAGDTDKVKIGWATRHVAARVRHLQAGCWETLHLLRIIPGERHVEAWLHAQFRASLIAREWFTFDPLMLTISPDDAPKPVRRAKTVGAPGPSPASILIGRFGGQTAMAERLGVSQSVVSHWAKSGYIPQWRIASVVEAGKLSSPPIILRALDFVEVPSALA